MKTIIAGSRSITDYAAIQAAVELSGITVTEVVSGAARGVDRLGEQWAAQHAIPVRRFPAKWDTLGKRAGMERNTRMAEYADALVAVWDGTSKGTLHMIQTANRLGLLVCVVTNRPEHQQLGLWSR